MSKKHWIIGLVSCGCVWMAFVDGSSLSYVIKAVLKITTFTLLPLLYFRFIHKTSIKHLITCKLKDLKNAFILGLIIYAGILFAYFGLRSYFDLSQLVSTLESNFGSGMISFIPIALYIAIINSFLEEFFFRGLAYLSLKNESSDRFSNLFSSISFALYHVFLMAGLFPFELYLLSILFLVGAGYIFNRLDRPSNSIGPSWLFHFFANWGLNTIGFILLGIIK